MRLRALDLFCCAGGAGMGLHRAGFDVVGVDIVPRRRYPFGFIQADALTHPFAGFDFIWASPPCQGYTELRHAPGAKGTAPQLISAMRERLQASGVPWVIENVEEAAWDMRNPITLCGSMFGLGCQGHQLRRHRLFESSFPIEQPACKHTNEPVVGVYGGHARRRSAKHGGRGTRDVWEGGHKAAASEAMGMDWATLQEMSEAIPPAYAEYIGRQALQYAEVACLRRASKWLRVAEVRWVPDAGEPCAEHPPEFDTVANAIDRVLSRMTPPPVVLTASAPPTDQAGDK